MYYRKKPENHAKTSENKAKSSKIELISIEDVENVFQRFLRNKRSCGVVDKTITSYCEHFKAAAKHFDIQKDINELSKTDMENMIISMRSKGLSPNTIKSYTITKSFLFMVQIHFVNRAFRFLC